MAFRLLSMGRDAYLYGEDERRTEISTKYLLNDEGSGIVVYAAFL